jgi:hypothetical protein
VSENNILSQKNEMKQSVMSNALFPRYNNYYKYVILKKTRIPENALQGVRVRTKIA